MIGVGYALLHEKNVDVTFQAFLKAHITHVYSHVIERAQPILIAINYGNARFEVYRR
jgi:hypothetical protein